ncbi:LysE family translocator [Pseudaestuariivita atlantica]|uniref:Lysine transporter LysE n=1 Tax=Pseudaestuariivita atlantica TaxID=1317121 RepID=A0A0L1JMJ2_9RHOB|nr:LysE family transporter [Pseudaestuariivita atlantica]KNG92970.1 lysine transporter LysE [Pseudaestuariivita atlantica]
MTWEQLIAFNLVLGAALISPGAAFLVAVRTSVSAGRAAGIATGLGLGSAAACWTLAALLGLKVVFDLFPWTYAALKIAGAVYLIWLAVQTLRHASAPLGTAPVPRHRAFLAGALVNFGNPKSMLFAAAVIVVVFPQGLAPRDIALITLNHLVLEWIFYTSVALALSSAPARAGYLRAKPWFDRLAAGLLGALGLRLLLNR